MDWDDTHIHHFIARWHEQDIYAAIEEMIATIAPLAAGRLLNELAAHLQQESTDLNSMVVLVHAGIQFCLANSITFKTENPQAAAHLRQQAAELAGRLASATWPGWNSPDLVIQDTHLLFGMEAARLYLRLSQENQEEPALAARGHWLLAAHCMARLHWQQAHQHFQLAATLAVTPQYIDFCNAYAAMCMVLVDPANSKNVEEWSTARQTLMQHENGEEVMRQTTTAYNVFLTLLTQQTSN